MGNTEDHDAIIILKEQMKSVMDIQEKILDSISKVSDDLVTFKSLITTGKWIFGAILLTLGALGHKGVDYISQLFSGN